MAKALTLGAVNLLDNIASLPANGYVIQATAEDTTWDNPDAIDREVDSWLQDGMVITRDKYGNRPDMNIKVRITGTDANQLAVGEMALRTQLARPNTLTWTPPGVNAKPCVFSIIMSKLLHSIDDMGELKAQPYRIFTLNMQAEPFVRSATQKTVTIPAPSGTQTITSIDACTSFTGWAGSAPGASSSSTGVYSGTAVFVTGNGYAWSLGTPYTLTLTRTGLSASLSTTPYVRVDLTLFGNVSPSGQPVFKLNGITVPISSRSGTLYWLDTTGLGVGSTLNSLSVAQSFETGDDFPSASLRVADVSRSNVLGQAGTGRQLMRTIQVAGSEATQGTLELTDATTSLGTMAAIYTRPSNGALASPDLRQYLISGNTQSASPTSISGFQSLLSSNHVFDIPITSVEPGGYLLVANLFASNATYTINYSGRTIMAGGDMGIVQSGSWTGVINSNGQFILGKLNLPFQKAGPSATVRIQMVTTGAVNLDEAWLFNMDTGRLTWVTTDQNTPAPGTGHNHLWVDSPSLINPAPAAYLGFSPDRSDQQYAGQVFLTSLMVHPMVPPAMDVFTITSHATAAALKFSHYPRFTTHVADV